MYVKKNLKKILNNKGPILIDVMIDPEARVKPKIEFGKPLHNMSPLLPKNEISRILNN
jgi:thiamine pyrophosphate-dependent acetolactate synthase large subunit-like protein